MYTILLFSNNIIAIYDHLNPRPGIFLTKNRVAPFGTICNKTRVLSELISLSRTRRDEFNIWG